MPYRPFITPRWASAVGAAPPRVGIDQRPDRLEYAAWWNAYGTLAIQIESVHSVINAGQLAKEGVDIFAFGPNDLMFSIEAHPHFPLRTVDECIKHVLDQIKDKPVKVALGIGAETPQAQEPYVEMGVTIFGNRVDI